MNSPMVVSQWLFIRHLLVFIVYTITVDILVICNLSAIRPSYISTNTMMVGADTGLVGLTLGVGQTGQVLLLLLLLMVFLIGIPVYLWFWRNYLKRVVAFYGGKVQVCTCNFQPMPIHAVLSLALTLTRCILFLNLITLIQNDNSDNSPIPGIHQQGLRTGISPGVRCGPENVRAGSHLVFY